MALKVFSHRDTTSGTSILDLTIEDGSTILIKAFDFSGPSFTSPGMEIIRDPLGDNEILALSAGDKYMSLQNDAIEIVGPSIIRISLTKIGPGSAVKLGAAIYYEEL